MNLEERYKHVVTEIAQCCIAAGRDPADVRLVAVSKAVGLPVIEQAVGIGISDLGENRPDSLHEKQHAFPQPRWHFIGNIQSRKIPEIVASADLVHSLYQPHHIPAFDAAAKKIDKVQDVLIEVNVSGEHSKAGLKPDEVERFIEQALPYENLRLKGFMTMAVQGDLLRARTCFDSLAELRHAMCVRFSGSIDKHDLRELSMGMSEDWRQAIEAGATIVRVGRAIFDDAFVERVE